MRKRSRGIIAGFFSAATITAGTLGGGGTSQAEQEHSRLNRLSPFTEKIEKAAQQIISLAIQSQDRNQAHLSNFYALWFTNFNTATGTNLYEFTSSKPKYSASQIRSLELGQNGPKESNFDLQFWPGKQGTWSMYCRDNPDANKSEQYSVVETNEQEITVNGKTVSKSHTAADNLLNYEIYNAAKMVQGAEEYQSSQQNISMNALQNICKLKTS